MRNIFNILIMLILFSSVTAVSEATILKSGTYEVVAEENAPEFVESARIKIKNERDGRIEVSTNEGDTWTEVGRVVYPCNLVSNQGYTASKWVPDGPVAATAVNAIHIKTDYNFADEKGVLWSILPKDMLKPPTYYNSYLSPDSSIYTDIPAGKAIFGGHFAPLVGNQVSTMDADGNLYPIGLGYVPKLEETYVIVIQRPKRTPKEVIFENRFGGLVTLIYPDGEEKLIGEVLKPVVGVGRFSGTKYSDTGRIRANHTAVIDISTSPIGKVGGFQIIPAAHGMSDEMLFARTLTQWMVVGPVSALDPSPEGVAPLYKYFVRPAYDPDDIDAPDWKARLLDRFLVQVKYVEEEKWQPMPEITLDPDLRKSLPDWAFKALKNVSHVRIMFPVYEEN